MAPQPLGGRVLLPMALVSVDTPREFVNRAYEAERLVVFRYLLSLGLDRETALDLTQETFLRLYRAVGRGNEITALRAWLFTTASRLAIDYHRAQEVRAVLGGEDIERYLDALPDQGPGPEAAVLRRERLAALLRAFGGLSPQQKVCLHLRAEGLRYREIASALGVSIPTVSEFMRRALTRLRSAVHD